MRTYTITGPDGKEYSIDGPEGATREQVIAKIQERIVSTSAAPKKSVYEQQAQKQSALENMLAGAGGSMYGLYLGAKQMLGKAEPEEIKQHQEAMKGLRSTTSGTVGEIGGGVASMLPAAFIPGANTYAGAGLIGALSGALQPTNENESRGVNTALGAGGGMAGKLVGDKVISPLIARFIQKNPQQAVNVAGELEKRGVDISKLSKEFQDSLQADVSKAANAGNQLDLDALARKAEFEKLGIQPTLGQLTRDPMQYQFERNSRGIAGAGEDLTNRFNLQNKQLVEAISKRNPGTADRYNAGEQVSAALKSLDEGAKKRVGELYEAARNAAGINTPLDPHRFTNALNDTLDQQMIGDALPSGIRNTINLIAEGKMPFTIQKAEQMRQAINGQMPKIMDRNGMALKTVNDALQAEIDQAGSATGQEAAELFKRARASASQRFGELDKSPALKAATEAFEPDDFVSKFVIRAKPGELHALKQNLQNDPAAWEEARGQVIQFLKDKATGGQSDEFAKFSQSGFKNALNSLGDARLKVLFSPEEISELKTIQRVAAAIQVQPEGSAVNNSGTSQAITNLMTRLSNVPYLKELAVNPLMNFRMQGQVNSALNPNIQKAATPIPQNIPPSLLLPLLGATTAPQLNRKDY